MASTTSRKYTGLTFHQVASLTRAAENHGAGRVTLLASSASTITLEGDHEHVIEALEGEYRDARLASDRGRSLAASRALNRLRGQS